MAVLKQNNADGGTNAVGVTAANSGGASGDAFDVVATNAAHTFSAFTTSPQGGSMNYWTNNVLAYNEWAITATEFWGSMYVLFYPNPGGGAFAGTQVFVAALGTSDAQAASLEYDTNNFKISVTGQGGSGKATTTGSFTALQWARVDWHFKIHASAGVAEARIYWDAVGAPNTYETITETSLTTLGTMAKLRVGITNSPAATQWFAYDDSIVDDAAWVNRDAVVFTGVPRSQSNIYRM